MSFQVTDIIYFKQCVRLLCFSKTKYIYKFQIRPKNMIKIDCSRLKLDLIMCINRVAYLYNGNV